MLLVISDVLGGFNPSLQNLPVLGRAQTHANVFKLTYSHMLQLPVFQSLATVEL